MNTTPTYLPRALMVAALVGVIASAFFLAAPQIAISSPPVENTHLLPEQHEVFRQAMAALETSANMVC